MSAAMKGLQFKQRDNTNQTYAWTQRKKRVEVLIEEMQMNNTGTEQDFFALANISRLCSHDAQSFASTAPTCTSSQKMEEGSCFENCAPPRSCKLALHWVGSARGFTEVHCVAHQGVGCLRGWMLYHHLASSRHLQVLTDPPRSMA